jgi:hypothetical protein
VNDQSPTFGSAAYSFEVQENALAGTPVTLVGKERPEVRDGDRGSNGTFALFLDDDDGVFEV